MAETCRVVIGGGSAGLEAARAPTQAAVEIMLIDRQDHHCFQPLLYRVATAVLTPADVAWPIRPIPSSQQQIGRVLSREPMRFPGVCDRSSDILVRGI